MCKSIAMHGATTLRRILNDQRNQCYDQSNINILYFFYRLGGDTAVAGERDWRHDLSQL